MSIRLSQALKLLTSANESDKGLLVFCSLQYVNVVCVMTFEGFTQMYNIYQHPQRAAFLVVFLVDHIPWPIKRPHRCWVDHGWLNWWICSLQNRPIGGFTRGGGPYHWEGGVRIRGPGLYIYIYVVYHRSGWEDDEVRQNRSTATKCRKWNTKPGLHQRFFLENGLLSAVFLWEGADRRGDCLHINEDPKRYDASWDRLGGHLHCDLWTRLTGVQVGKEVWNPHIHTPYTSRVLMIFVHAHQYVLFMLFS